MDGGPSAFMVFTTMIARKDPPAFRTRKLVSFPMFELNMFLEIGLTRPERAVRTFYLTITMYVFNMPLEVTGTGTNFPAMRTCSLGSFLMLTLNMST
jgi:hypothetical protein